MNDDKNDEIACAAAALVQANYLLILAGAGFSADSGLDTYEQMPEKYQELCNPIMLVEDEARFQRFWTDFAEKYESCVPHAGYEILDNWCAGGKLPKLQGQTLSSWFVYTSNVDGHFLRYKSFHSENNNSVCEIHGNATEFRCSVTMAEHEGKARQGAIWRKFQEKVKNASCSEKCRQSVIKRIASSSDYPDDDTKRITCPHCSLPCRPNVLMFHDTDSSVLYQIQEQRDRYQAWEAGMEEDLAVNGRSLVIVEFGCGLNVPAVRNESKEVFIDCMEKIKNKGNAASVTLIRVNPKDAFFDFENDMNEKYNPNCISIYDTSLNTIRSIDKRINMIMTR